MQEIKLTLRTARVLREFLRDPGQPCYGYELMAATGVGSGTLYPMLARLVSAGWLARGPAQGTGLRKGRSPVRYTLTAEGAAAARAGLAAISAELAVPGNEDDRGAGP